MVNRLIRLLLKKKRPNKVEDDSPSGTKWVRSLAANEKLLQEKLAKCGDVKYHSVKVPLLANRRVLITYVEGLINTDILNRDIIAKLMSPLTAEKAASITDLIAATDIIKVRTLEETEHKVLSGDILLLADGESTAFLVSARNWPMRAIDESIQERTIRGPRDSFTEVAKVNLGLIRRRLPDASLKVENITIGRRASSSIYLLYVADVADDYVVQEVRERIEAVDIDGILEPGALAELITERTVSPFPLLLSTERPDKAASGLLSGKIVIISDGSPFCMLAPIVFADYFQVPEDYYMHPAFAFFGRLLRFISIFVATTLTAAYTAIITFHYEVIPKEIIIFIAETREGVPFNPFTEALLLEIAIELVREASIRLPATIGPTIGIVGALILGQAIVQARLVSPVMLIVVAAALMANFNIPNFEAALTLRLIRFPILAMAAFL